jgi:hypothetical protein
MKDWKRLRSQKKIRILLIEVMELLLFPSGCWFEKILTADINPSIHLHTIGIVASRHMRGPLDKRIVLRVLAPGDGTT